MSERNKIKNINPTAGVEGGEVIITCEGYNTTDYSTCSIQFGDVPGKLVSASPNRVISSIPEYDAGITCDNLSLYPDEAASFTHPFKLGAKIADNIHPITNPAIDHSDNSIYVTLSGSRGQKSPVSIYKISGDEKPESFVSDIMNASGLAFDRWGTLHVTSRYDGILYKVTPFREVQTLATDLGIATGIAFDTKSNIYVGDRTGTIFRVNEIGEARPFASLDASISAYHLAFSPDGDLYVTGPSFSSYDSIMRIDAMGNASKFYNGLGRPQGLAFDVDGNLYVAASLHGQKGIIKIDQDGKFAEPIVAGSSLVGLAFDDAGNLVIAANHCIFKLHIGIKGYSVF